MEAIRSSAQLSQDIYPTPKSEEKQGNTETGGLLLSNTLSFWSQPLQSVSSLRTFLFFTQKLEGQQENQALATFELISPSRSMGSSTAPLALSIAIN